MTILQVGQRVRSNFYWAGRGIVVGIGQHRALDICFDNGARTSGFHVDQLEVLDDVASPAEVRAAIEFCAQMKLGAAMAADIAAAAYAARVAYLRTATEYAHLQQTDGDKYSGWCGKLAAKNVRTELRIAWPEVKFSVRKVHYGQVEIRWTGGPSTDDVQVIAGRYVSKSFDGMQDLESSVRDPFTDVFGCGGYCSTQRERTAEESAAAEARHAQAGSYC